MIGDRAIRLVITDTGLEWQTDPALLGQALLNLVRNAVEAIPGAAEGEVCLDARAVERDHIVISVRDTGAGISNEAIARLFEPFFTTKTFGTGLGLAITRKIVTSLSGKLELHRRADGGTEAMIRMPRAGVRVSAMSD
jgi:two-component system sensor histidine kinase HydH